MTDKARIVGLKKLASDLKSLRHKLSKEADKKLLYYAVKVQEWAQQNIKQIAGAGSKKGRRDIKAIKPRPTSRSGALRDHIGPPKKLGLSRYQVPARTIYAGYVEQGGFPYLTPALEDHRKEIEEGMGVKIFSTIEGDGWPR